MTITRNFKLYLNAGTASAPYINVNQYDEGEEWIFTLYNEDGSTYTPSSGAIIGIKSDGNAIMNAGSVVGGKVVITETEQMTAASGRAIFELLIDNATHGTANFIVNVERRPSDDAEFSDSDLSMLQEAIDAAEVINEILDEGGDPSEIIAENVDAWLDNHPEATTTVEDGAITAPKINNSLWDKILVNEEVSGNPASFEDGADDVPVSSLKVSLEPIQIGSGDPSPSNVRPIIASNGKNVLPLSLANMKSINTSGTWSGNAYTLYGVTYTVNTGEDDTVASITVNGTASQYTLFRLVDAFTASEAMILSGSPTGSSTSGYRMQAEGDSTIQDNGNGANIPAGYSATRIIIVAPSGTSVNNAVFKPMLRLASIKDSSYQPYQGVAVERTGKNLLKNTATSRTVSGVTFTVNDDGSITTANTATANITYTIAGAAGGGALFKLEEGKEYTFSGAHFQLNGTTAISAMENPATYTAQEGDYISFCWLYIRNGQTFNRTWYPQCEVGTEATEYEPFASNSYPYTLGQSVYGGKVDLATGVLTVTHGFYTFTGSENPYIQQTGRVAIKAFQGSAKAGSSAPAVCSHFVAVAGGEYAYITTAMTDTELKTYMANNTVTIAYNLETPQTINLTPTQVNTLLGYNNISSSGTVEVIYHADTKLYVDKMTAVDNNIIAPTEADFVATRNYTVNDLVIVNDTLYKVTSNIASGSTITPNSNVTATTLGALIKALS